MKNIIVLLGVVTVLGLAYFSTSETKEVRQDSLINQSAAVNAKITNSDTFNTENHIKDQRTDGFQKEKSAIDDRMEESIKRFRHAMDSIPAGAIEDEREDISRLREKSDSYQPSEPLIEVVEDEFGNKVRKYTFENGIVRYGLM